MTTASSTMYPTERQFTLIGTISHYSTCIGIARTHYMGNNIQSPQ